MAAIDIVTVDLAPEATYPEAIQGWRCWRVLPFKCLDGSETYRLCAVGTLGVPKTWEPRQATAAVCSGYDTHHEAPWLSHECGIWALNRREAAFRRMVCFMQSQTGQKAGWAFGQVSLWGRVVEHEKGWRSQYAYPYELEIHSFDPAVADAIRDEYAVDTSWAGAILYGKVQDKLLRVRDNSREELNRIRDELVDIRAKLAKPTAVAKPAPPEWRWVPGYKLKPDDWVGAVKDALADDEIIDRLGCVSSRDVAELLAEPHDSNLPLRPCEVSGAGVALQRLTYSGRIVQVRRRSGTSRWTLPGVDLSKKATGMGYKPVLDAHAELDAWAFDAIKATLKKTRQKSAAVREVLAHIGESDASLRRKVIVSQAMGRNVLRGKLEQVAGWPHEWSLA